MYRTEDILATLRMIHEEHLDVRTITMGIDLTACAERSLKSLCSGIRSTILSRAEGLAEACQAVAEHYAVPIVNRQLAVSPIATVAQGHGTDALLEVAQTLDGAAAQVGVDLVGGYTALVQKGSSAGARNLIASLPTVLSSTQRVCASVNVASTHAGINVEAILEVARAIKQTAERTADQGGFGCAKLCVFANAPADNPFMAGAFLGQGEPDCVINIGVSGPGVVKEALVRLLEERPDCTLGDLAEEIKSTAFRVTRVGELIGREVAARLDVPFGIVDLSLAPTPKIGDSVGEILQAMGIGRLGAPGSTAALALLNDAVKKGGSFASSSVGGLSGAFIPVSEDHALAEAVAGGHLSLEKLEAMTCVCSVGLDMIAVPGDTTVETLASLIADEAAIGVFNNKTTAVRVIPVPGKQPGDRVAWGGLFGEAVVMPIPAASPDFIHHAGRIPAPLASLRN